jgi:hypothetical protein
VELARDRHCLKWDTDSELTIHRDTHGYKSALPSIMSQAENPLPKKRFKIWKIALLSFVALTILVAIFDDSATTITPEPTPSPTEEVLLKYSGELTRWEPINPASGRAVFTIRNTGDVSFIPQSCTVRVQDDSGTYKGYDYISGFGEIKPGAKFMGNVVLTVTKEGSLFVTRGSVDCELEASP